MARRNRSPVSATAWRLTPLLLALLVTLSSGVLAEEDEGLRPVDVARWVSALWEPLYTQGGDLQGDDAEEVVAILHRSDAVPGDEEVPVGARGLAIFTLNPRGGYFRTGLAERILPCVSCLGPIHADPRGMPFEVDIDNRELRVGWVSNADGLTSVRLTIAWDAERGGYGLVADEVVRAGAGVGTRSRRVRDYRAGTESVNGETRPIEPRFIPIEAVSALDYR